jgi:hypothetical protein
MREIENARSLVCASLIQFGRAGANLYMPKQGVSSIFIAGKQNLLLTS